MFKLEGVPPVLDVHHVPLQDYYDTASEGCGSYYDKDLNYQDQLTPQCYAIHR
jgi:hypothetical protein